MRIFDGCYSRPRGPENDRRAENFFECLRNALHRQRGCEPKLPPVCSIGRLCVLLTCFAGVRRQWVVRFRLLVSRSEDRIFLRKISVVRVGGISSA
jgi:hypothetical protein